MAHTESIKAVIVDYGLGNLFSVKHACAHAGMGASIVSSHREIMEADVVILPGVGAFGDAMDALKRLDLVGPLREVAASGKFLVGICLGMQLLMNESHEFGRHKGLGIIQGPALRFRNSEGSSERLKVPQVGWNRIYSKDQPTGELNRRDGWKDSPLSGLDNGEFMYFIHSFYVVPQDEKIVLSVTHYGEHEFCSSLQYKNVFACQFHPERSGPNGLHIYRNIVTLVQDNNNHSEGHFS